MTSPAPLRVIDPEPLIAPEIVSALGEIPDATFALLTVVADDKMRGNVTEVAPVPVVAFTLIPALPEDVLNVSGCVALPVS